MDSPTKSAIKQLVLDLRHTLEDEIEIALKRYGIFTDRKWSPDEVPERLAEEAERESWRRIAAVVRRRMKEGRSLAEATRDYVRESGFTFLNRLVGLKCLEVRGIIDEIVTTRDIYGGRSRAHRDYRDEHPREARAADDALPAALQAAIRHVNDTLIGYLFDPDDDHSLVWPRYAVLKTCIEKINALDESVWREDEIIGWIYQWYNFEEKATIRSRGDPQVPHEVAVLNQFFTPRWVVKFLVDNTLGRLWLEMRPDSPRVRAKCDYLVPELLAEDRGQGESKYTLDPDSPINNPHSAPRREEKPVTEIRLLDPACGTMHFGHYSMEVFQAMYQDSRVRGETQIADERIPGAILENNLYGVDIDPRAVQLAALSLFMKARTLHPQARVRQVNLVVADATMPDSGVKRIFLARYAHDRRLQQAVAQVLEDLDQVARMGSLLPVEERLRELLVRAGHAAALDELDARRQHELPGMQPTMRQLGLSELLADDKATAWTPHVTLREVRDDLRAFGRLALREHDVNAQLFATEADKAVRLLDVLMSNYDAVVMNPPFGGTLADVERNLKRLYPHSYKNLLCAFLDRARSFTRQSSGLVGAIVDKSSTLRSTYESFRSHVLLRGAALRTMVDLGWDILDDANVETVMFVLGSRLGSMTRHSPFFRVADQPVELRSSKLESLLANLREDRVPEGVFPLDIVEFESFPNKALSYWVPSPIRLLFRGSRSLDPSATTATEGIKPADADRFIKYWWEVKRRDIGGRGKKWALVSNGGYYSPFYRTVTQVVLYENNGEVIKAHRNANGQKSSRTTGEEFYYQSGITYGKRTNILSVQRLETDCLFTNEGHAIFPHDSADTWCLIAMLNSQLLQLAANALTGQHKAVGYVRLLPYIRPTEAEHNTLGDVAKRGYELKKAWDVGNEICNDAATPWLLQLLPSEARGRDRGYSRVVALLEEEARNPIPPLESPTLSVLLDHIRTIEELADSSLQTMQLQIDEAVYDLYNISSTDRTAIDRELANRPLQSVWPDMLNKSDREKRCEHVRRLFSYFALQAVREDEDGIVPLAGHARGERYLIDRVRARLEAEFGAEAAYQLEQDATPYLGRSLEEWLHSYFFRQFHVELYRNRPTLWHLTSSGGYFAALIDYHKLTRDTLPKVQSLYLWPQMEAVRSRLAAAKTGQATLKAVADLEAELADLEDCNGRLEQVIQGTVPVMLPDWARGPYRDGRPPYDPDPDDGVAVNLLPIQEAGLLPVKKVV